MPEDGAVCGVVDYTGTRRNFGDEAGVQYLDCGDGFTGV